MVFAFANKYFNAFNISNVVHNKTIQDLFPIQDERLKTPGIAFKYTDTIRNKVLNYKQVIQEGIIPTDCVCHSVNHEYIDANSNHVFTGNLNIIENHHLRGLLKKGLKFREVPTPNKEEVLKSLKCGLQRYITEISIKKNIPEACFLAWKMEILRLLQLKIDKLQPYSYDNVLAKKENSDDLLALQNKFVFIPTDKAGNNITVVCKKQYMESLDQEICNSNTFVEANDTPSDISKKHAEFLKQYGLKSSGKIPYLYWIAKLHKNPFSRRFITSGKGGSLEELSQNISICLKSILKIISSDAKYHKDKTGIRKCFVINNRDPVIKFIKDSNIIHGNKSVKTFDFETLYTSIPQLKLKEQIGSLIKSIFVLRKKRFISVSGTHAYFAMKRSKSGFSVSFNELVKCINFVIDNSYINYKNKIYKQEYGIPMGTNCAPYLANLFLHCYEVKFIDKLVHDGKIDEAKMLNSVFRYQDDCIVFNDQDYFFRSINDIYPIEMVLKETNITESKCNYLDISVQCINDTFCYESYDKRREFCFDVINYPDLAGNVPICQSYGVFVSQVMRFCEINDSYDGFVKETERLVNDLLHQGFNMSILKTKFVKFYMSEINRWAKFGKDITEMSNMFSH